MKFLVALKLPFQVLRVVIYGLYVATIGLVWRPKSWSYQENLRYKVLRSAATSGLVSVLYGSGPRTTTQNYQIYMEKLNLKPVIVQMDKGAKAGWIGSPKAKSVIMFLHGGGYVIPGHPFGWRMHHEFMNLAQEQGKDISLFIFEYSLAPAAKYPIQLNQAAIALTYLIETAGYQPENARYNIFIVGESAGGNIALGLMAHLLHPHPEISAIDLKGQKLAGLVAMSPKVTFDQSSASMKRNAPIDMLSKPQMIKNSADFLGDRTPDIYNAPLSAQPEYWKDFPVKDTLILCGEYELFLDDVRNWTKKVQVHNPRVELFSGKGETHIHASGNRALGLGMAESEKYYRQWLLKRL